MSAQGYNTKSLAVTEAVPEHRAVTAAGAMADAVTERVYGITYGSATASGDNATIVLGGKCYCQVDGSGTEISEGDLLAPSSTDGTLVKDGGTATHIPCAIALEDADEVAEILVNFIPGLPANP